MLRLALLRPWGRAAWNAYFQKLYPTHHGAEFDAHLAEVVASLHKPGHWNAFQAEDGRAVTGLGAERPDSLTGW